MSERGTLLVRVEKYLEGGIIRNAVPVRIRQVRGEPGEYRSLFAAPATRQANAWANNPLPPGSYDVEAVLPSGEILSERIEITAGKDTELVLRGEQSPNEWRSWAHFSGVRDVTATAPLKARIESRFDIVDAMDISRAQPDDYAISIGSIASAPILEFPVESWPGWFDYLDERWKSAHSPKPRSAELQLKESPSLVLDRFRERLDQPLRVSVRSTSPPSISPTKVGRERQFVAVTSANGTRLVSIPWPWLSMQNPTAPFFQVMISETATELLCDPVVVDEHLGGIMAYVNSGRLAQGGELLLASRDMLFAKYENPLGAAAAGYVLLSSDASDRLPNWPDWLGNLAHNFPYLPDGAILRAKWLLDHGKDSDRGEALTLLREALHRGIPFFSAGIAWLVDGWRLIAADDPTAARELRMLETVARSIDLTKGLTSFRLPALEGRSDQLRVRDHRAGKGSDPVRVEDDRELVETA